MITTIEPAPTGNKQRTKVTITETTTKQDIESSYPMLNVKTDKYGEYIHCKWFRFVPGSYFFVGSDGIPTYFSSLPGSIPKEYL
jgi:hypothetical protein